MTAPKMAAQINRMVLGGMVNIGFSLSDLSGLLGFLKKRSHRQARMYQQIRPVSRRKNGSREDVFEKNEKNEKDLTF
jgi:hypothetical protein